MLLYYVCNSGTATIAELRSHLRDHNKPHVKKLTLPIKCMQGQCKSTFTTVGNFMRHLDNYHRNDESVTYTIHSEQVNESSVASTDSDSTENSYPPLYTAAARNGLKDIQAEGEAMVASLRPNSSIPYGVVSEIVSSVNHIVNLTTDIFQTGVLNSLQTDCSSACVEVDAVKAAMTRQSVLLNDPLNFISTRYKQDKHCYGHPLAVKPERVDLGLRMETRDGVRNLVHDSFQYVSIEATLRSLLTSKEYVKSLFCDSYTPGIIKDCRDGKHFQTHPLFGDPTKLSLMIHFL